MAAFRYFLIISGTNFDSNICQQLLDEFSLHTYDNWSRGDRHVIGKKTHVYDYSGIIIIHDDIYATNENGIRNILNDYLCFFKKNSLKLKESGATDFELIVAVYLDTDSQFTLITKNEMSILLSCVSPVIRCEILYFNKHKYSDIIEDLKKEQYNYEKISNKKKCS